jgi:hypothetical protein
LTVAENCWVVLAGRSALFGDTGETLTAGTVAVHAEDLVGSATEVAVIVTVKSDGG